MAGRAVFVDRDGTVIWDAGYPRDPADVAVIPGAADALAELARRGFAVVVVSNQSGIGRGLVTQQQADAVHDRFVAVLQDLGARVDGAYYCPHAPDEGCSCRKPSPELVFRAADDLGLDVAGSFMVGDKPTDVETGRRAGCTTILLDLRGDVATHDADHVAGSWEDVTATILGREVGAA